MQSAKIENSKGLIQQAIILIDPGQYTVSVDVRGPGLIGVKIGEQIVFERSDNSRSFKTVSVTFEVSSEDQPVLFLGYSGDIVRYDNARMTVSRDGPLSPSIARATDGTKPRLIAGVPPSQNFDLSSWYLSVPTDEDENGRADNIMERQLVSGYSDARFFFTSPDGGMTFRVPVEGYRTSENTKFTRSELREMLRRGDTSIKTKLNNGSPNMNNWVLSSAPAKAQAAAGALDGVMEAELQIDHVTSTGETHEQGRVIIGQIHAKDDELIRLYYRKLQHHQRGSVYFAHERKFEQDDIFIMLIGDRASDTDEPMDGIRLGERFGYKIEVKGNRLDVEITQAGQTLAEHTLDMSDSGYDVADDYLYFKAGVYTQNHTGELDDFDQATFYKLEVRH